MDSVAQLGFSGVRLKIGGICPRRVHTSLLFHVLSQALSAYNLFLALLSFFFYPTPLTLSIFAIFFQLLVATFSYFSFSPSCFLLSPHLLCLCFCLCLYPCLCFCLPSFTFLPLHKSFFHPLVQLCFVAKFFCKKISANFQHFNLPK